MQEEKLALVMEILDPPSSPEAKLWRMVVIRQLLDLVEDQIPREYPHRQLAAWRWLTQDKEDFKVVCDYAGINGALLRTNILRIYNKPEILA